MPGSRGISVSRALIDSIHSFLLPPKPCLNWSTTNVMLRYIFQTAASRDSTLSSNPCAFLRKVAHESLTASSVPAYTSSRRSSPRISATLSGITLMVCV
uniref:Uncharacterized protein n=1 Tax=Babesia bovis TaxID=5865 RepID=S6B8H8_BABBO|nr:hypothetical protein [Babesia bovis]